MKIDCKITENYFSEKKRMCNSIVICNDCPMYIECPHSDMGCYIRESSDFNTAINIVQKWSDEHQQKTILDYLLERFPDTPLDENGMPKEICPSGIGFPTEVCKEYATAEKCTKCWSRLYEEN